MILVVKNSPMFDTKAVLEQTKLRMKKYDRFDRKNDRTATMFLYDSISDELAKELRNVSDENDPFVVLYLRLMEILRTSSILRFERLKDEIRNRRPAQYAGEDIAALCNDMLANMNELERAGQLDPGLLRDLLRILMMSKAGEDFHFKLHGMEQKLDVILVKIGLLRGPEAQKQLEKAGIPHRKICKAATSRYHDLVSTNHWPST